MQATFGLPDRGAVPKRFERAGATFDTADFIHAEARTRLLSRLPLLNLEPRLVLDLGAATGKASVELAAMYPGARILPVDLCRQMAQRSKERCAHLERTTAIVGDAQRLPLRDASVDLVYSNLMLPWCDPREVFAESTRVLREGGLLLFTTVGPDTLQELRLAWSEVDDSIHVHGFTDMHDLGDLANRTGLAEPVLDVDRLTVTYAHLDGLVADLRACGATNIAHGRRMQLTGRSRWREFRRQLESQRTEAGLAISVELIFGQAWGRGAAAARSGDGTVSVSVDEVMRTFPRS